MKTMQEAQKVSCTVQLLMADTIIENFLKETLTHMHWPHGGENPDGVESINSKGLKETDIMNLYHSIWSDEDICIHQYEELFMK